MTARNDEIPVRLDGLQLDERPRLQSVIWIVQRMVWVLCLMAVIVALAGGTGQGGPWAVQSVQGVAGAFDAPRVTRRFASDLIALRFVAESPSHTLTLPADFLTWFEVETITPRPQHEEASPEGVTLHFTALGPPPHRIALYVTARQVGLFQSALTLDGTALPAHIIVLP